MSDLIRSTSRLLVHLLTGLSMVFIYVWFVTIFTKVWTAFMGQEPDPWLAAAATAAVLGVLRFSPRVYIVKEAPPAQGYATARMTGRPWPKEED